MLCPHQLRSQRGPIPTSFILFLHEHIQNRRLQQHWRLIRCVSPPLPTSQSPPPSPTFEHPCLFHPCIFIYLFLSFFFLGAILTTRSQNHRGYCIGDKTVQCCAGGGSGRSSSTPDSSSSSSYPSTDKSTYRGNSVTIVPTLSSSPSSSSSDEGSTSPLTVPNEGVRTTDQNAVVVPTIPGHVSSNPNAVVVPTIPGHVSSNPNAVVVDSYPS